MKVRIAFPLAVAFVLATLGCSGTPGIVSPSHAAIAPSGGPKVSADLADISMLLGGSGKTLLVLDIDDTLLTSPTFYGSDDWYVWQRDASTNPARNVPCLFDVIAINTESGTQVATQANATQIIDPLLSSMDSIILTSRNAGARGATIRELKVAGYSLPTPLGGQVDGVAYRYRKDAAAREVTVVYDQGVFMTEGQDKGVILLNLLDRLHLKYERIVLVDDGPKNHADMQNALTGRGIEYRGLLYTRAKKMVDEKMRLEADDAWKSTLTNLEHVFPDRAKRLKEGKCAP